jgi:DMSO/TMAO reductase YedYZ molybdopterin-dependent catalytic subunit
VVAVGDKAITLTPEWLKEFGIRTFGENDKIVLVGTVLAAIVAYSLVVGLVSLRSRLLGVLGIALFAVLGVLAAATRNAGSLVDGIPALVGAVVGVVALLFLIRPLLPVRESAPVPTEDADVDRQHADERIMARLREVLASGDRKGFALDRRRFFLTSGVALGAAVVTGGGGRLLQRRFDVAGARADIALPTPSSAAPALPAGADLSTSVPGLTPLFTANSDFYRVDTAISVPQISPSSYSLQLSGMFDAPRTYTLQDLFDRDDLIERDITLTCVSNEVGGNLASTARWIGVPLGALLREAGVRSSSDQLLCRSVDGMTIGTPTVAALSVEDAMLALSMNGEPLLVEHGFPVRMLIPGLYGYVSACKWLTGIEATTYGAVDAYWTERDWVTDAPIKVFSRIDTPSALSTFPAGRVPIAGIAWAQTRGIAKVEVKVDDADYVEATLAPTGTKDLWQQWVLPFDFTPGQHQITVRATDGDGTVQTADRAEPFPSGATGLHSIRVVTS